MKIKHALIALSALAASGSAVLAQPPQGGGGPPGQGHGGPGGNPILGALDPDHNHELSAAEIKNATKALLALDKNGDGKLDETDLGQMGPPGGGPGGQGRPGGGPPGGGPGGRGGGDNADRGERVNDFSSRLLAFDKNDNGKIEKAELPERMQRVLERVDTNKDDVIDESELNALKSAAAEGSGGGNRGGASGRRGRDGAEGGRGRRGGREGGNGGPGMRGGPPGGGGGMDRMIEHAFEYDSDGDGKLSREELMEFARNMPQPGGGPGMGGGPPGGPGGQGGRGGPPRGGRGR